MPNPFQQRASEYQRSDTEFLATLTPALFRIALDSAHDPERLLSKTTVFSAPPGTGKTTMARFFQYTTLRRLLEREGEVAYKELFEFAVERGFIRDRQVVVCGARVSLERDFRELSLIGYSPERAHDLMISLVSARAILAWRQAFAETGVALESVRVVPTVAGASRLERMGAGSFVALAERAAEVASKIYGATARFIPPTEEALLQDLGENFFPLLAIGHFELAGLSEPLTPLLMLDDAHWIDRKQHEELIAHLALRELEIGRWVFQRMEALDVDDTLLWGARPTAVPGVQRLREVEDIRLTQSLDEQRSAARKKFRRAAEEVTSRYMAQLPDLARHGIGSLNQLTERPITTDRQVEAATAIPEKTAKALGISPSQVEQIRQKVYALLSRRQELASEVLAPAMTNILLHRQFRRQPQRSLFGDVEDLAEPVLVEPDLQVAAGAQVHLWHELQVPFLAGFETVADLGTENVETFLQLAWQLVKLLETQVVRGDRSENLTVKQQHEALRRESEHIINSWGFPHAMNVRRLAHAIAEICKKRSLEPNAPLGGGANSIGIEQSEFAKVVEHRALRDALFYGMAYSAFVLVPGRRTKNKLWTIIELGGPVIAYHGLTPDRGGFVPMSLTDVAGLLEGEGA